MLGVSNHHPEMPKMWWVHPKPCPDSRQIVTRLWGRPNGLVLQVGVAKICSNSSSCGASMVEIRGGRRRAERGERDVGSGGFRGQLEEKTRCHAYLLKCPSITLFFVPSLFIFDTASLIRNPNSKPKSIII